MLSLTKLKSMFGDYSQNSASTNLSRAADIMNIEHRYLLQKYFNNEGSFSVTTVGAQTLASTGALSTNAISATLTAVWPYHSTTAYVTFSNGNVRQVSFQRNSTAISWTGGLTASATTVLSVGALQFYPVPPNYSKMKDVTVTVGTLKWTPSEVYTRQEWDQLNVFPYYADIPKNFFIYGGQVGIWPIPSTSGNVITYNYKFRVPDLSIEDDITGTVAVNAGATAITGTATAFVPTVSNNNESRWIQIAQPKGDNLWYQISSVDTTTGITLYTPYYGTTNVSGGSFTIGQMPLIPEDFHDMLLWKGLTFYFTSIVSNPDKVKEFQTFYEEKHKMLESYAGSKTVQVNLRREVQQMNPNLYPQNLS